MLPEQLIKGYKSFLNGRLTEEQAQRTGQDGREWQPDIMVISCADSPATPESIFNANPGNMFVFSNIANLVPVWTADEGYSSHDTGAAIEFGIEVLKVKHIIVLGHTDCCSIHAFANKAVSVTQRDSLGNWMSQIDSVANRLDAPEDEPETWIQQLEQGVIEQSLKNLMSFPCVHKRVEAGTLVLHGAYVDVTTGILSDRDPVSGEFKPYLKH